MRFIPEGRFLVVIAIMLLICTVLSADGFTGGVVKVSDGDTIKVMRESGTVNVRLHGVDAPEKNQAFGDVATEFTTAKVYGRTVRVDVTDVDRYGRLVGIVFTEGSRTLNQELVAAGLAWWYRRYAPGDGILRSLEAEARNAERNSEFRGAPEWRNWRSGIGRGGIGARVF